MIEPDFADGDWPSRASHCRGSADHRQSPAAWLSDGCRKRANIPHIACNSRVLRRVDIDRRHDNSPDPAGLRRSTNRGTIAANSAASRWQWVSVHTVKAGRTLLEEAASPSPNPDEPGRRGPFARRRLFGERRVERSTDQPLGMRQSLSRPGGQARSNTSASMATDPDRNGD